jgi:mRNA-degrading endonuclease RelE of RelBE toxin-antitoxin system
MLQWIKRIRATRQFRRLVKAGFGEPFSSDELAQLEASWVEMRVENLVATAPAGAKYAFGWVPMVRRAPSQWKSEVVQMPQRLRPAEQEPSEPAAQESGLVHGAPPEELHDRVRFQESGQLPIEAETAGNVPETAEKVQWLFAFTRRFSKDIAGLDRKLQGRVLEAINEICHAPLAAKGDTVKPLVGDSADLWRYRIGDFRLVYHPDAASQRVTLLRFASRGSVYG